MCYDSTAAPKCFAFCLCALVLWIVRRVLRGRDVVPSFAVSSGSAFEDFRAYFPLLGVSNDDTTSKGLLVVVLGLAVLLLRKSLDVSEVFLE